MFSAYENLGRKQWIDEAINVPATNVQRLAELARFKERRREQVVSLTFVNGFPALQQLLNAKELPISKLISTGKLLTVTQTLEVAAVAT